MKVSDLIQILENMPKDATVIVSVFNSRGLDFDGVFADEVCVDVQANTVTIY